jgi:hypothetical protein
MHARNAITKNKYTSLTAETVVLTALLRRATALRPDDPKK